MESVDVDLDVTLMIRQMQTPHFLNWKQLVRHITGQMRRNSLIRLYQIAIEIFKCLACRS